LKIEIAHGREVEDKTPSFQENEDPVRSFIAEAVRCAREGGEPVVRPNEIVQVQAVMDAIYESARTAGTVKLSGD
jgi:predicted dehydrogenase